MLSSRTLGKDGATMNSQSQISAESIILYCILEAQNKCGMVFRLSIYDWSTVLGFTSPLSHETSTSVLGLFTDLLHRVAGRIRRGKRTINPTWSFLHLLTGQAY